MKILIVEDEEKLLKSIKEGLVHSGYAVDTALDGDEGSFMAFTNSYDLIIFYDFVNFYSPASVYDFKKNCRSFLFK